MYLDIESEWYKMIKIDMGQLCHYMAMTPLSTLVMVAITLQGKCFTFVCYFANFGYHR